MTDELSGLAAVLGELIAALAAGASERQIIDRAVASAMAVLPVDGAGVTLLASGARTGIVAASDSAAHALERLQTELGEGPCLMACDRQQACLSPDLAGDRRFARYTPAAVRAGAGGVFAFPLRSQGRSLGAIDLYRDAPGQLSDTEIAAAQMISDAVAALLIDVRRHGELESAWAHLQSIVGRDPLTGLPGRILLVDRLSQAIRRRDRSGRRVGVAFVDLDDFKLVNDHHGHAAGDRVLVTLARRLTSILRPGDTLARWGGDEFVIVCEDLAEPVELDRLLVRVCDQLDPPFEFDGTAVSLRASYGTAMSTHPDDTPEGLIDAADRGMYADKRLRSAQAGRVSRQADRVSSDRPIDVAADANLTVDAWKERWISGPVRDGAAVTLVAFNERLGELTITELDDRLLVIARHQWLPTDPERVDAGPFELTVTDWDERELARRRVASLPPPPTDPVELTHLLSEIGSSP